MARKKRNLNLAIEPAFYDSFHRVALAYGHVKQKGDVLAAALLMFVEADPVTQASYLKRIASARIDDGVTELVEEAKLNQARAIAARESKPAPAGADVTRVLTPLPSKARR